jgi:formylglycine-generating enzyme required for sulfatase activity
MTSIKGGTLLMGSNNTHGNESPIHKVTIDDYYIGKTLVTVSQFKAFIDATNYKTDAENSNGSYVWTKNQYDIKDKVNWRHNIKGDLRPESEYNHPVIHISFNDATAYCNWLSQETGKKYRLPTEAEWEYAARNDGYYTHDQTKPYDADFLDEYGWYKGNSDNKTHPVASKKPNKNGLYDMIGNVWEWCSDWYEIYYSAPVLNPKGAAFGLFRVKRGGCWNCNFELCRPTYRYIVSPHYRNCLIGFRIILAPFDFQRFYLS